LSCSAKLAKPLQPRDHAELRTLADARDYMLKLPDAIATWQAWLRRRALAFGRQVSDGRCDSPR